MGFLFSVKCCFAYILCRFLCMFFFTAMLPACMNVHFQKFYA